MTEHKHFWVKTDRKHGREGFFFVKCSCSDKEYQANKVHGYLHVFDTSVDKGGQTSIVSARLSDDYVRLLKKSNKTVRELLENSLDFYRDV